MYRVIGWLIGINWLVGGCWLICYDMTWHDMIRCVMISLIDVIA